jgi:DNA-binding response OmpR family regulator
MAPDTGADDAADLPRSSRPGPAGVTLDPTTRRAILPDGAEIRLTPLQFAILAYLVARAGRPCSRAAIMCEALGYPQPVGTRTVDMHVASLRSKLGRAVPIRAVRGVGYLVPRSDPR